jgi:DNA (cytosine-5)-methyltransferase 1
MLKTPTVIDLFCGAGGLSLGFDKAGFKVIWANDNNKWACETYAARFGKGAVQCCNIEDVKEFPKADVVVGGYPCQGFSLAGNRLVTDPRNTLYLEFAKCIKDVRPKFFVAENVPGLLTLKNGEIIEAMVKEFGKINGGYNVKYTHKPLNAMDYGVPQERKRVFIVGVRKDIDFEFDFPEPTHGPGLEPHVTLKKAIGHMPAPKDGEVYDAGYSSIYMSRNRKKSWDDVSFTIQAGARHAPQHPEGEPMKKVRWSETHPEEDLNYKDSKEKHHWLFQGSKNRRLSYKECAAVQSFPEEFEFKGPLIEKYAQIGNAVPPRLAEAVASEIIKYFEHSPE